MSDVQDASYHLARAAGSLDLSWHGSREVVKHLWLLIAVAVAVFLIAMGRTAASILGVNAGMVQYIGNLMAADVAPGDYPHAGVLEPGHSAGYGANSVLERALSLEPDSDHARWALGRTALASAAYGRAAEVLAGVGSPDESGSLLSLYDEIVATSQSGDFDATIALHRRNAAFPIYSQVVSDTLAVTYLENCPSGGRSCLAQAHDLRPWDLYVNHEYHRLRLGQGDAAGQPGARLARFPIEALDPKDERLLGFAARVIPELLAEGAWTRDQAINAASFLSWSHFRAAGTEELLQRLVAYYPEAWEWPFLLAQVYHRRNDLKAAEAMYQQALTLGPERADILWRLSQISQAQEDQDQAESWRLAFEAAAAADVRASLPVDGQSSEEAALLARDREDLQAAAGRYDIPSQDLRLGKDLLQNGDFEISAQGRPEHWLIADYATGEEPNAPSGAYFAGLDRLERVSGNAAARIDGVWQDGTTPGFFGWVSNDEARYGTYALEIAAGRPYLVSGYYRTGTAAEAANIYLGNPQVGLLDEALPATDGRWQRFAFLGCHGASTAQRMQLIVRLQSTGQAWFDGLTVRAVEGSDLAELCARASTSP